MVTYYFIRCQVDFKLLKGASNRNFKHVSDKINNLKIY